MKQKTKTSQTQKILNLVRTLEPIETSWCDSLPIENEKFNNVSITISLNDFNFITTINIEFHTQNPPGFIYTGEIKVTDFNNKQELENLIKKQIKQANTSITEATFRAAQMNLFERQ